MYSKRGKKIVTCALVSSIVFCSVAGGAQAVHQPYPADKVVAVALDKAKAANYAVQTQQNADYESSKVGTDERTEYTPEEIAGFRPVERPVDSHTATNDDASPVTIGAQPNSMENFKILETYPNFADVPTTAWYYGNVKTAFEYGFVKGSSATTFSPTGNLTIQEAVVLAARMRCIYVWGTNSVQSPNTSPVGNEASWATPEINYAIQEGIIKSTDFNDYTATITRAQMAYIFAHALPSDTGVYATRSGNVVEDNAIPDVAVADKYGSEIYTLYRAGVLTGGDGNAFSPDKAITRAETAAIASRLPFPNEHKAVNLVITQPGTSNTGSNIPAEYMPVYVTLLLTEQDLAVANGMNIHMYGAEGKEYPVVSSSDFAVHPGNNKYNSSQWVFAAPKDSSKVPVKLKFEAEGLTGLYQVAATSWGLGKMSDEIKLINSEGVEGFDDDIQGLSEEFPIYIGCRFDQAPAVTCTFVLEGTKSSVTNIPITVTEVKSGETSIMYTNSSGRIFLSESPSGSWQLELPSNYTFASGLTKKDVQTTFHENRTFLIKEV